MSEPKSSIVSSLEIAANLGIVIGLLLVAFQIAQQEDIAQTEVQGELFSEVTAHYQNLAGENPAISIARAIDEPVSLSTEDHVVLFNLYMAEFSKAMRQESMPGYKLSRSAVARWSGLVSNPYGYAWWKTVGSNLAPFIPQLYAAVEEELEPHGIDHADGFQNTQAAIKTVLLEIQERE